jgi:ADP-ribose pyrophosphatase YjhB (NUDIX family)
MDKKNDYITLVLGSTGAVGPRNPLDSRTRYEMIQSILDNDDVINKAGVRTRILCYFLRDSSYNWTMFGKWLQYTLSSHSIIMNNHILCGMEYIKEYANLLGTPFWQAKENVHVHATDIRHAVAENDEEFLKANLPAGIFADEDLYLRIKTQILYAYNLQLKYIKDLNPKYASVYKTVDNIILCGGHILFVVRKDNGKYALPGGFQDPTDISAQKAAERELREETGLDSSDWTPAASKNFDAPYRDPRSSDRVNAETTAFLYRISPKYELGENGVMYPKLPEVVGQDDAARAIWLKLSDVCRSDESCFHADHKKIILNMLGLEPSF